MSVSSTSAWWLYNHRLKRSSGKSVNNPITGKLEHSQIRVWVQRFQMIAFVPLDEWFSPLLPSKSRSWTCRLPQIFEQTWIQGASASRRAACAHFLPISWNSASRTICHMNRTNYTLETFNHTMGNFLAAMYPEQVEADAKILKASHGNCPAKKRCQHTKDHRIHYIVSMYALDAFSLA